MTPDNPQTADGLAGAVLTIDLAAIVANYRLLRARAAPAACAAVVKADAYGLGVAAVAPALAEAGCRVFFVAHATEALALRAILDGCNPADRETIIYVLNGMPPGLATECVEARIRPVLNSLADVDAWAAAGRRMGVPPPVALHIDTGMSRLGLTADETAAVVADRSRLDGVSLSLVMSHLACADQTGHPLTETQCATFRGVRAAFPGVAASLANSSGIFLGGDALGDLVRPGSALYGVAPASGARNPMNAVVRLQGRILQVRDVPSGATVGYGATFTASSAIRIAVVAVGYADGYLRSLGNRGAGYVSGQRVPLVGRVSMDLTTFDVSGISPEHARPGAFIELIGPDYPVDDVAADAGTIGYEILTALGRRYHRVILPASRS